MKEEVPRRATFSLGHASFLRLCLSATSIKVALLVLLVTFEISRKARNVTSRGRELKFCSTNFLRPHNFRHS